MGRLIDADILKHEFARIAYEQFKADMGQDSWATFTEKDIERIIDSAQTVLEEINNKQGEWIYREEWFDDEKEPRMAWGCNQCGRSIKSVHEKRNFCPNCGAAMRSKEDEVQDKSQ